MPVLTTPRCTGRSTFVSSLSWWFSVVHVVFVKSNLLRNVVGSFVVRAVVALNCVVGSSSSVSRKLPGLHGKNPSLRQAFRRSQNPSRRRRRVASFHGFHVRASRRRRSRRQAQVRHRYRLAPGRSARRVGPQRVVGFPLSCCCLRVHQGIL